MAGKPVLPLGITDDGRLVKNPYPNLSRLVIGASGAAKTTSVVVPTAQALFGYPNIAVLINDPKQGEVYAQLKGVARETGRRFACIDDLGFYGFNNPDRLRINPYGALLTALKHTPDAVNFALETITHAHIPEVDDGKRNFHFRESPRRNIHLVAGYLAEFQPNMLTPGAVTDLLSDPDSWRAARENAAHEGSPALRARALASLQLEDQNPEEYARHYMAAVSAMAPYEAGSPLNLAGADAEITHEELCRDGYVVCVVLPQVHAKRVGVHMALHQSAFLAAQYSGQGGQLHCIIDEMTNSPQKEAVEAVTIQRSSRTTADYVAQSFVDIERQYGKQQAAVLADNVAVKQYLAFSDEDAERVSKLMGEEISIQRSMNVNPEQLTVSGSMNTGKQPVMTPDELKNLNPAYQVLWIKGYGWLVCRKLFQNQIAPTGEWLAPNPQEGGALPYDPRIELPVHVDRGEAA